MESEPRPAGQTYGIDPALNRVCFERLATGLAATAKNVYDRPTNFLVLGE